MKNLIGIIVLILLVGILGWQFRSYLPLPDLSPAPKTAPVPTRGKIPQMPPTMPIQTPEASTPPVVSDPDTENAASNEGQTVASVASSTSESLALSPDTVQENPPAVQAAPAPAEGEKTTDSQTQPMPEPAPSTAETQPQPVAPAADTSSPPATPSTESSPAEPVAASLAPASEKKVAAAAPESVSAPKPDKTAPYTIQVGAYLTKQYADEKLAELTQLGYNAFIFQVTDRRQRTWHAVRFGHFDTREDASRTLSKFKSKEKMDAIISRSSSL